MTGDIQYSVSHTADTEGEEKRFDGHNAHIGDMTGVTGMFSSTKENREARNEFIYPGGRVTGVHEVGGGSIDSTYRVVVEPARLTSAKQFGENLQKRRGLRGVFDRFRRK